LEFSVLAVFVDIPLHLNCICNSLIAG